MDYNLPLEKFASAHLSGVAIFPSSPSYASAVAQWNSVFDTKKPTAIVFCSTRADVRSIVLWLSASPSRANFSVRSSARGGHLWNGVSVADGGVVLDLSRLNTIAVEDNRYARLGPGVEQGWANRVMKPFQRMFPTSGDCNQFAFGGFVQGGGFGLWARGKGIAADYLVEATVVLMDGTEVVAREGGEYADLLWALRGGGAGNFGIVTEMVLDSFPVGPKVLSMEAFWALPESPEDTARLLRAWARVHKGDRNPELGAWLFLIPGDVYEFKFGGVWAGDDMEAAWAFWTEFEKEVGLPLLAKSSILELNPQDANDVHQLTAAGRDFFGSIDSRKMKGEWTDDVLAVVAREMAVHAADPKASFMYILFPHGGVLHTMDPDNEKTSYGKRDSPGDLLLLVSKKGDGENDLDYYTQVTKKYAKDVFDVYFSKNYYPGHACSHAPLEDLKNAYYDYDSKPWLYEKLLAVKQKYDPTNMLHNIVSIPMEESSSMKQKVHH